MFSQQDKDYITEVLIRNIANADRPRQVLTAPFQHTDFSLRLAEGGFSEMIISAVQICIADGWTNNPMWMEILLDIFQLRIVDGKIKEIWDKAKVQPPPIANPLDITVLNNTIPFVNRKSLRLRISQLEAPATGRAQPILVVNGDEKSGKSYSTNFIDHFCNSKPAIITYPIAIEPGQEMDTGAEEIARDLLFLMGAEVADLPKADTNMKKHAETLAKWVLNAAVRTHYDQHWFILDNFNSNSLKQTARDFLIALSDTITKGVFPIKCRLIIIGFDPGALTVGLGKVNVELIQACTIADIDMAINEVLMRTPAPLSPASVTSLGDFVKTNLPPGKDKMAALNTRLRIIIHSVNRVSDIIAVKAGIGFEEVFNQVLEDLLQDPSPMDELNNRLKALEQSINEI